MPLSHSPKSGTKLTGAEYESSGHHVLSGQLLGVYDACTAYGAVADGVTDDQPAIQAAVDDAGAAGGGIVLLSRPGTYLLTSLGVDGPNSQAGHIWNKWDRVSIHGVPGAILMATDSGAIIFQGKGADSTDHRFGYQTVYATSSIARGDVSVTLTTPADAANFSVGDHIIIRTGQTIGGSTLQPDAEINRVRSVDAGTGVIGLAYQTVKAYAQEYFVSGTSGVTSTSVTANAAAFGIANVEDIIVRDQSYIGLGFEYTGTRAVIIGGQAIRTTIERCTGSYAREFESRGSHRFTIIRGCVLDHPVVGDSSSRSAFSVDAYCSDAIWADNILTGLSPVIFHVHEGATRTTIIGNSLSYPDNSLGANTVSVRARARDTVIVGNIFEADGGIIVDGEADGGVLTNNLFRAPAADAWPMGIHGPNWVVGSNSYIGVPAVDSGEPYIGYDFGFNTDRRVAFGWLSPTVQTVTIKDMPLYTDITGVRINVVEAFDSDGTNLVTVGWDASASAIATSTDVSTTGQKSVTLGGSVGYRQSAQTVKAYYTPGGSQPTHGAVLVCVEYANIGRKPTN